MIKKIIQLNIKNKLSIAIFCGILIGFLTLLIGQSYAIFSGTVTDENNQVVKLGNLEVKLNEPSSAIKYNLESMSDVEGLLQEDIYTFSVENIGSANAIYKVLIIDDEAQKASFSGTLLNEKIVKLGLEVNGEEKGPLTLSELNGVLNEREIKVGKKDTYSLRLWIDDDVDLQKIADSKIFLKLKLEAEQYFSDIKNLDRSGANKPELVSNMIPVYYDETNDVWRKADSNNYNKKYQWYDYSDREWANAVTISNFTYESKSQGAKSVSIQAEYINNYKETTSTYSEVPAQKHYTHKQCQDTNCNSWTSYPVYSYYCCTDVKPTFSTTKRYSISGTYTELNKTTSKYCVTNFKQYRPGYSNIPDTCSESDLSEIRYTTSVGTTSTSNTSGNNTFYYYPITGTLYKAEVESITYTPSTYKISNTYTIDKDTKKYILTNPIIKTYSSDYVNYYMCSDKKSTTCDTIYQIKEVDDDTKTVTKVEEFKPNVVALPKTANYEIGDEIPMDDISTMWVWIPRYKYTYLNISKPQNIKIKFESGTDSTGTIKCTDNVLGSGTTSEICTDTINNGIVSGKSTYTHPAFTFGDKELTGIWVGKFENSATAIPTSNSTEDLTIIIKPDVQSLRYKAVSYMFKDTRQMEASNNAYNFPQSSSTTFNWNGELTGDTNDIDTHMMKNMEWGAVAYLSHSKYGINKEININNSSDHYTGRSGGNVSGATAINTVYTDQTSTAQYNEYGFYTYDGYLLNYGTNTKSSTRDMSKIASSTGNTYGVYDMSGGAEEYVMANEVNSSKKFYSSSAANWSTTLYPLSKYYDSYTYGSSYETYARGKLGDATKETRLVGYNSNWYLDYARFLQSASSWFRRGGAYSDGVGAGIFEYYSYTGDYSMDASSRTVLIKETK